MRRKSLTTALGVAVTVAISLTAAVPASADTPSVESVQVSKSAVDSSAAWQFDRKIGADPCFEIEYNGSFYRVRNVCPNHGEGTNGARTLTVHTNSSGRGIYCFGQGQTLGLGVAGEWAIRDADQNPIQGCREGSSTWRIA